MAMKIDNGRITIDGRIFNQMEFVPKDLLKKPYQDQSDVKGGIYFIPGDTLLYLILIKYNDAMNLEIDSEIESDVVRDAPSRDGIFLWTDHKNLEYVNHELWGDTQGKGYNVWDELAWANDDFLSYETVDRFREYHIRLPKELKKVGGDCD